MQRTWKITTSTPIDHKFPKDLSIRPTHNSILPSGHFWIAHSVVVNIYLRVVLVSWSSVRSYWDLKYTKFISQIVKSVWGQHYSFEDFYPPILRAKFPHLMIEIGLSPLEKGHQRNNDE